MYVQLSARLHQLMHSLEHVTSTQAHLLHKQVDMITTVANTNKTANPDKIDRSLPDRRQARSDRAEADRLHEQALRAVTRSSDPVEVRNALRWGSLDARWDRVSTLPITVHSYDPLLRRFHGTDYSGRGYLLEDLRSAELPEREGGAHVTAYDIGADRTLQLLHALGGFTYPIVRPTGVQESSLITWERPSQVESFGLGDTRFAVREQPAALSSLTDDLVRTMSPAEHASAALLASTIPYGDFVFQQRTNALNATGGVLDLSLRSFGHEFTRASPQVQAVTGQWRGIPMHTSTDPGVAEAISDYRSISPTILSSAMSIAGVDEPQIRRILHTLDCNQRFGGLPAGAL